jgi:hypothetical protein
VQFAFYVLFICGDKPDTFIPCQVQEEPQSALRRACNIILSQNAEASTDIFFEVRNSNVLALCTSPDAVGSPFVL